MPSYYKINIQGTAVGQGIQNTLYYAQAGTSSVPTDPVSRLNFLTEWMASAGVFWLDIFPNTYTLQTITGTVVDDDNTTISTFPVGIDVGEEGTAGTMVGQVYEVAIVTFRLSTPAGVVGNIVPRRSYVALGPLVAGTLATSGQYFPPAGWDESVGSALGTTVTSDEVTFSPYRVGSEDAPGNARVGLVSSLIIRPYASVRRSRKIRPTGEGGA